MTVKGSYRQLVESEFLAADDIIDNITVEISGASIETVTSPNNQKKQMICLSFKGARKKLALNRTNGRAIAKIAGTPKVEEWTGVKICLYRTTIKAFGDPQLPAIRVKPTSDVGGM